VCGQLAALTAAGVELRRDEQHLLQERREVRLAVKLAALLTTFVEGEEEAFKVRQHKLPTKIMRRTKTYITVTVIISPCGQLGLSASSQGCGTPKQIPRIGRIGQNSGTDRVVISVVLPYYS
jgi:hypothetical protein